MDDIRRLLVVSDAPHFGGAEQYVTNMVAAAQARGIASVVWWARPETGTADVFAGARRQGADVRIAAPAKTRHMHTLCREFRAVLHDVQPQAMIVNACGRPRFWSVPWLARLEGVPSVWVHHMVDQQDYRRLQPDRLGGRLEGLHLWRWPQALRHRLAACAATAVVALNQEDRRQVAREHCLRPHRVHVVPNGVDTARYRFDPLVRAQTRAAWSRSIPTLSAAAGPHEPFIVGSAGRLVHGKGFEMLIQAVATLRADGASGGIPIHALIAGDGPDRELLSSIVARLGLAHAVTLLGHVEDMPAFYCGLDAFALCSSTESFGLVLTEAMGCERAVLATPTAGARAQLDDGRTGIAMESFSADELAACLRKLHTYPALRDQLGHSARCHVIRESSVDAALVRTLSLLRPRSAQTLQATHVQMPASSTMEEAA